MEMSFRGLSPNHCTEICALYTLGGGRGVATPVLAVAVFGLSSFAALICRPRCPCLPSLLTLAICHHFCKLFVLMICPPFFFVRLFVCFYGGCHCFFLLAYKISLYTGDVNFVIYVLIFF